MSIVQNKRDEMMNNVTKETATHAAKSERATASSRRISGQSNTGGKGRLAKIAAAVTLSVALFATGVFAAETQGGNAGSTSTTAKVSGATFAAPLPLSEIWFDYSIMKNAVTPTILENTNYTAQSNGVTRAAIAINGSQVYLNSESLLANNANANIKGKWKYTYANAAVLPDGTKANVTLTYTLDGCPTGAELVSNSTAALHGTLGMTKGMEMSVSGVWAGGSGYDYEKPWTGNPNITCQITVDTTNTSYTYILPANGANINQSDQKANNVNDSYAEDKKYQTYYGIKKAHGQLMAREMLGFDTTYDIYYPNANVNEIRPYTTTEGNIFKMYAGWKAEECSGATGENNNYNSGMVTQGIATGSNVYWRIPGGFEKNYSNSNAVSNNGNAAHLQLGQLQTRIESASNVNGKIETGKSGTGTDLEGGTRNSAFTSSTITSDSTTRRYVVPLAKTGVTYTMTPNPGYKMNTLVIDGATVYSNTADNMKKGDTKSITYTNDSTGDSTGTLKYFNDGTYTFSFDSANTADHTIYVDWIPTTADILVTKTWDDKDDAAGLRARADASGDLPYVTVQWYDEGNQKWQDVNTTPPTGYTGSSSRTQVDAGKDSSGAYKDGDYVMDKDTTGNHPFTFEGLPVYHYDSNGVPDYAYRYRIVEEKNTLINGYADPVYDPQEFTLEDDSTTTADGYNNKGVAQYKKAKVTNTVDDDKITVEAIKHWADEDIYPASKATDTNEYARQAITFTLHGTTTDDNGTVSVVDLNGDDAGTDLTLTIQPGETDEKADVTGYVKVDGETLLTDGTNYYILKSDGQYYSVTYNSSTKTGTADSVAASPQPTASLTPVEMGDHTYAIGSAAPYYRYGALFENLPVKDNGLEISYTVTENDSSLTTWTHSGGNMVPVTENDEVVGYLSEHTNTPITDEEDEQVSFDITKVDRNTDTALKDATFTVYTDSVKGTKAQENADGTKYVKISDKYYEVTAVDDSEAGTTGSYESTAADPQPQASDLTATSETADGKTVYQDTSGSDVVNAEVTTNSSGSATITFKKAGTYYVKETTAPEGYKINANTYVFEVDKELKTVTLKSADAEHDNLPWWKKLYQLFFESGLPDDIEWDETNKALTVKDEPITANVLVRKVWDDNNNQDGMRTGTLPTVTLQWTTGDPTDSNTTWDTAQVWSDTAGTNNTGALVDTETRTVPSTDDAIHASVTDAWTWRDLPAYKDGKPVYYRVKETGALLSSGEYTIESNKAASSGKEVFVLYDANKKAENETVTITNKHVPQVINLKAIKKWAEDNNNADNTRGSAKFKLYKIVDGVVTGEVTTDSGTWQPGTVSSTTADGEEVITWKDLPAYENGKYITYRIKEEDKSGNSMELYADTYKTDYPDVAGGPGGSDPSNEITANMVPRTYYAAGDTIPSGKSVGDESTTASFIVTNTLQQNIDVKKIWVDGANENVKFQLYRTTKAAADLTDSAMQTNTPVYYQNRSDANDKITVAAYNALSATDQANYTAMTGNTWSPFDSSGNLIDGWEAVTGMEHSFTADEFDYSSRGNEEPWTFKKLPKKDANGKTYIYRVYETPADSTNFATSYSTDGLTVTNTNLRAADGVANVNVVKELSGRNWITSGDNKDVFYFRMDPVKSVNADNEAEEFGSSQEEQDLKAAVPMPSNADDTDHYAIAETDLDKQVGGIGRNVAFNPITIPASSFAAGETTKTYYYKVYEVNKNTSGGTTTYDPVEETDDKGITYDGSGTGASWKAKYSTLKLVAKIDANSNVTTEIYWNNSDTQSAVPVYTNKYEATGIINGYIIKDVQGREFTGSDRFVFKGRNLSGSVMRTSKDGSASLTPQTADAATITPTTGSKVTASGTNYDPVSDNNGNDRAIKTSNSMYIKASDLAHYNSNGQATDTFIYEFYEDSSSVANDNDLTFDSRKVYLKAVVTDNQDGTLDIQTSYWRDPTCTDEEITSKVLVWKNDETGPLASAKAGDLAIGKASSDTDSGGNALYEYVPAAYFVNSKTVDIPVKKEWTKGPAIEDVTLQLKRHLFTLAEESEMNEASSALDYVKGKATADGFWETVGYNYIAKRGDFIENGKATNDEGNASDIKSTKTYENIENFNKDLPMYVVKNGTTYRAVYMLTEDDTSDAYKTYYGGDTNNTTGQIFINSTATPTPLTVTNEVVATNTGNIAAVKQLMGRQWLSSDDFTFTLEPLGVGTYDASGNLKTGKSNLDTSDLASIPMPAADTAKKSTTTTDSTTQVKTSTTHAWDDSGDRTNSIVVDNDTNHGGGNIERLARFGAITFKTTDLTYDEADGLYKGDFFYTMKEQIPDDAKLLDANGNETSTTYADAVAAGSITANSKFRKDGIIYSDKESTVHIKVSGNSTKTLEVQMAYDEETLGDMTKGTQFTPVFTNIYEAEGTANAEVRKYIMGRDWKSTDTPKFKAQPLGGAPFTPADSSKPVETEQTMTVDTNATTAYQSLTLPDLKFVLSDLNYTAGGSDGKTDGARDVNDTLGSGTLKYSGTNGATVKAGTKYGVFMYAVEETSSGANDLKIDSDTEYVQITVIDKGDGTLDSIVKFYEDRYCTIPRYVPGTQEAEKGGDGTKAAAEAVTFVNQTQRDLTATKTWDGPATSDVVLRLQWSVNGTNWYYAESASWLSGIEDLTKVIRKGATGEDLKVEYKNLPSYANITVGSTSGGTGADDIDLNDKWVYYRVYEEPVDNVTTYYDNKAYSASTDYAADASDYTANKKYTEEEKDSSGAYIAEADRVKNLAIINEPNDASGTANVSVVKQYIGKTWDDEEFTFQIEPVSSKLGDEPEYTEYADTLKQRWTGNWVNSEDSSVISNDDYIAITDETEKAKYSKQMADGVAMPKYNGTNSDKAVSNTGKNTVSVNEHSANFDPLTIKSSDLKEDANGNLYGEFIYKVSEVIPAGAVETEEVCGTDANGIELHYWTYTDANGNNIKMTTEEHLVKITATDDGSGKVITTVQYSTDATMTHFRSVGDFVPVYTNYALVTTPLSGTKTWVGGLPSEHVNGTVELQKGGDDESDEILSATDDLNLELQRKIAGSSDTPASLTKDDAGNTLAIVWVKEETTRYYNYTYSDDGGSVLSYQSDTYKGSAYEENGVTYTFSNLDVVTKYTAQTGNDSDAANPYTYTVKAIDPSGNYVDPYLNAVDADGNEYIYTIAEPTSPSKYDGTTDELDVTNTNNETVNVPVTKEWKDGPAIEDVTLRLYRKLIPVSEAGSVNYTNVEKKGKDWEAVGLTYNAERGDFLNDDGTPNYDGDGSTKTASKTYYELATVANDATEDEKAAAKAYNDSLEKFNRGLPKYVTVHNDTTDKDEDFYVVYKLAEDNTSDAYTTTFRTENESDEGGTTERTTPTTNGAYYLNEGDELFVTNTVTATNTANIAAVKQLLGRAWDNADDFSFTLEPTGKVNEYKDDGTAKEIVKTDEAKAKVPMPENDENRESTTENADTANAKSTTHAKNGMTEVDENGQLERLARFGAITYDVSDLVYNEKTRHMQGDFFYTMKEVIPSGATNNGDGTYTKDGITYDATEHTVHVRVTENRTNELLVQIAYDEEPEGDITTGTQFTPVYTNKVETTTASITKVWSDNKNAYNTRPDTLTMELWRKYTDGDGNEVEEKVAKDANGYDIKHVMSADDKVSTDTDGKTWKLEYKNLPKYVAVSSSNDSYTAVTVDEGADVSSYYTTDDGGTTYTAATGTAASGTSYYEKTTTTTWSHTEYTYYWKENGAPDGYSVSGTYDGRTVTREFTGDEPITALLDNNTTVTNTLVTGKVVVTKTWDDQSNKDGTRPTDDQLKAALTLFAGDHKVTVDGTNITCAVTDDDDDTNDNVKLVTYTGLPIYDKTGAAITYRVEESTLSGYTTTYTTQSARMAKDDSTDPATWQADLALKNSHTPDTINLNIDKVWVDTDADNTVIGERPSSIIVKITAEVSADDATATFPTGTGALTWNGPTDRKYTATAEITGTAAADSWKKTIASLPKLDSKGGVIKYTVSEDQLPNYKAPSVTEDPDGSHNWVIINTYERTEFTGTKVWADGQTHDNTTEVTLTVHRDYAGQVPVTNASGYKKYTKDSAEYWYDSDNNKLYDSSDGEVTGFNLSEYEAVTQDGTVSETVDNAHIHWSGNTFTITGLPEKTTDGKVYTYWVSEDTVPTGYRKATYSTRTHSTGDTVDGITNGGTITNTPKVGQVAVTKKFVDSSGNIIPKDKLPADFKISITYYELDNSTGKVTKKSEKLQIGDQNPDSNGVYSWIVGNVAYGTKFTAAESGYENPTGYTFSSSTATIDGNIDADKKSTYPATNPSYAEFTMPDHATLVLSATPGDGTTAFSVDRYPASVSFVNTYTEDTGLLSPVKIWDDASDQDGVRPNSVTFKITATNGGSTSNTYDVFDDGNNGKTSTTTVTLKKDYNDGDTWKYINDLYDDFLTLPTHAADGTQITYVVEEETVPTGYTAKYESGSKATVTLSKGNTTEAKITNEYTPLTDNLKVTKTWDDDDANGTYNAEGLRPENSKVTMHLYKVNTYYTNNSGDRITAAAYAILNPAEKSGYTSNTELVQVDVPEKEITAAGTASATGGNAQWDNLPVYEGGQKIKYIVLEESVAGYTTKYKTPDSTTNNAGDDSDGYISEGTNPITTQYLAVELDGTTGAQVVDVKNSLVPATSEVTVTKVWDDNGNNDGKRPNSVEIKLYEYTWDKTASSNAGGYVKNNTAVATITLDGTAEGTAATYGSTSIKTQETAAWTGKFTNLPMTKNGKTVLYEAEETTTDTGVFDATTTAGKYLSTPCISGNQVDGFTVTNKYTPETKTATVTKVWVDSSNTDRTRPDTLTLELWRWYTDASDAKAYEQVTTDADGKTIKTTISADDLTSANTWSTTISNLPKYKRIETAAASGSTPATYASREYTYFWRESVPSGYTATASADTSGKTAESGKQQVDNEGTLTNALSNTSVTVTKKWIDKDENTVRPNATAYASWLQLKADGDVVKEAGTDNPLKPTVTDNNDGTYTATWSSLPMFEAGAGQNADPIVYTVTETDGTNEQVTGYGAPVYKNIGSNSTVTDKAYDGGTITNTQLISVDVKKIWVDNDNHDGKRGDIKVTLYQNGVVYKTGILTSGEKTLKEANATKSTTTTENDTWTWTGVWTDLPYADANGSVYNYTATETGRGDSTGLWGILTNAGTIRQILLDSWNTDKDTLTFEVTNTEEDEKVSFTVDKVWSDNNDVDNLRPAKIYYRLYQDYSGIDAADKLIGTLPTGATIEDGTFKTANNGYIEVEGQKTDKTQGELHRITIKDLPAYAASGKKITYTIAEDADVTTTDTTADNAETMFGYTTSQSGTFESGFTVTNTHTPATVSTTPTAKKAITGREFKSGDSFTFKIEPQSDAPRPAKDYVTITPSSGSEATITLPAFTFTGADMTDKLEAGDTKTFEYKLTEVNGGKKIDDLTYDSSEKTLKITVTRKSDGGLQIKSTDVIWGTGAAGDDTFTNAYGATTDLTIRKIWRDTDADNTVLAQRPTTINVTVTATATTNDTVTALTTAGFTQDGTTLTKYTKTVAIANTDAVTGDTNAWQKVVEDLPKYDAAGGTITYSVSEAQLPNYAAPIITNVGNTFVVVNTYERTTFTGTKVWVDGGKTHDNVTELAGKLKLYRTTTPVASWDGTETWESVTIGTTANSAAHLHWLAASNTNPYTQSFTITGLPAKDTDGNTYIYRVVEEGSVGTDYKKAYTNTGDYADKTDAIYTGGTVTNTLDATKDVSGTKTWVGGNDDDHVNADSADNNKLGIQLFRKSAKTGASEEQVTNAVIKWNQITGGVTESKGSDTFNFFADDSGTKLPKYDSDGYEYSYYVKETIAPQHYTPTGNGTLALTNTYGADPSSLNLDQQFTKVAKDMPEGVDNQTFSFILATKGKAPAPTSGVNGSVTVTKAQSEAETEVAITGFGSVNFTADMLTKTDDASGTNTGTPNAKYDEFEYTLHEKPTAGWTTDKSDLTITVKVVQTATGDLTITVTPDAAGRKITNTYDPTAITSAPTVKKKLTGRTMQDSEFTINLTGLSGTAADNKMSATSGTYADATGKTATGTNTKAASGTAAAVEMGNVSFNAPGKYLFEVSEASGTLPGITYDATKYYAEATVTAAADGTHTVTWKYVLKEESGASAETITATEVTFENAYSNMEITETIAVKKTLNGRTLKANEFEFILAGDTTNASGDGTIQDSKKNAADGTVTMDAIKFTLEDLCDHDGSYLTSRTFTYKLFEKPGTLSGVTYDGTVHTLEATLKWNATSKQLEVVWKLDNTDVTSWWSTSNTSGTAVEFTNTYDPSATTSSVTDGGTNTLTGGTVDVNKLLSVPAGQSRSMLKDEFLFELVGPGSSTDRVALGTNKTAGQAVPGDSNDRKSAVSFAPVTFTKGMVTTWSDATDDANGSITGTANASYKYGTLNYTIKEIAGNNTDELTYSTLEIPVTATLYDIGDGKIYVKWSTTATDTTFVNSVPTETVDKPVRITWVNDTDYDDTVGDQSTPESTSKDRPEKVYITLQQTVHTYTYDGTEYLNKQDAIDAAVAAGGTEADVTTNDAKVVDAPATTVAKPTTTTDSWTIELSKSDATNTDPDNWFSDAFKNLPKYDAEGTEIVYTLAQTGYKLTGKEAVKGIKTDGLTASVAPTGYATVPIALPNINGLITSFINTLEVTNITGTKTWVDGGQTHNNSAEVTFKVERSADGNTWTTLTNGQDYHVDWSGANDSTFTIRGLTKYVDANASTKVEYQYKVTETAPDNYTVSYKDSSDADADYLTSGGTIINTAETVSVYAKKVWAGDDSDKSGRQAVTFQLYQTNGDAKVKVGAAKAATEDTATFEPIIDSTNSNCVVWTNLPKYVGSTTTEYTYTVEEVSVPNGYTMTVGGGDGSTAAKAIVITNTKDTDTINVPVMVKWDDANDHDGIRPNNTEVVLQFKDTDGTFKPYIANGYASTKTLSDSNNWKGLFTGLPKTDSTGKDIEYKVVETRTAVLTGTDGSDTYGIDEAGDSTNPTAGFVITNIHTIGGKTIKATKTWAGDTVDGTADYYGLRTDVILHLYGKNSDGLIVYDAGTKKITKGSTDAVEWNVPIRHYSNTELTWEVVEEAVFGYTTSYSWSGDTCTVTNTFAEPVTEVSVTKDWQDAGNADGKRPNSITYELWSKVGDDDASKIDSKTVTKDSKDADSNGWSAKWTNLPATKEVQDGTTTTTETRVELKYKNKTNASDIITVEEYNALPAGPDTQADYTAVAANTLYQKNGSTGTDDLITQSNYDNLPTDSSGGTPNKTDYTAVAADKLYQKNGSTGTDGIITDTDYNALPVAGAKTQADYEETQVAAQVSTSEVPKMKEVPIIYFIKETYTDTELKTNGYDEPVVVSTGAGTFEVINKRQPDTIDVVVTKVWVGDTESVRPGSIGFKLSLEDGTPLDTASVTVADEWKYTFKDVPKADKYVLTENTVNGYDAVVVDNGIVDGKYSFTVTNTRKPASPITLEVTKVWKDAEGNVLESQPHDVNLHLVQVTKDSETVVPDKDKTISANAKGDALKVTWSNLPGEVDYKPVLSYTVTEDAIDGYRQDISTGTWSDGDGDGYKEKLSITITNTKDADPETITVTYKEPSTFADKVIQGPTTIQKGEKEPNQPADPSHSGYTFTGWKRTVDAAGNVTYTATYAEIEVVPEKKQVYYVDPKAADGSMILKSYEFDGQAPTDAAAQAMTGKPANPKHKGYDFVGWVANKDKTSGDWIIVAKYNEVIPPQKTTPTVSYIDPVSGKLIVSQVTDDPSSVPEPVAEKHKNMSFAGWNKIKDAGGNTIYVGEYICDCNNGGSVDPKHVDKSRVDTGDYNLLWFWVMVMTLSAAAIVFNAMMRQRWYGGVYDDYKPKH